MKFNNVRLSKTFSAIISVIVVGFFLMPALTINFMVWHAENREQRYLESLDEQIEARIRRVALSLQALNIADSSLLNCIHERSLERARLPPDSAGGIDSVLELQQLSCPNRGIRNLDGMEELQQLISVNFDGNYITNVDVMAKLNKLEEVGLTKNSVVSIVSLTSLPFLKKIRLSGNNLISLEPLLLAASLKELDMPDTSKIFCVDVENFFREANFVVVRNDYSGVCKGQFMPDVSRIMAMKKEGSHLTPEEEGILLEHEYNKMKNDYNRKYK